MTLDDAGGDECGPGAGVGEHADEHRGDDGGGDGDGDERRAERRAGTVVTLTLPPGTSYNTATLPSGWFAVDNGDGTVTLTTTNVLDARGVGGAAGDGEHCGERGAGDEPGIPGRGGQQQRRTRTRRNNSGNSDTSVVSAATLSISKTSTPDDSDGGRGW